jgi:hypothetical protein
VTIDDNALEQRLLSALHAAAAVEPSSDLWTRVLHSIDEDQRHRRRVISVLAGSLAVMLLAVVAVLMSLEQSQFSSLGYRVGWWRLELVETAVLVTLIAGMAPAIRRFGRGYADDLFPTGDTTGDRLVALLDVAYLLIFTGYLLASAELTKTHDYVVWDLGEQLASSLARVAGLLLLMGVLHAATFIALPILALVANTTRTGRRLPGWVAWLVAIPFLALTFQVFLILIAGLASTFD